MRRFATFAFLSLATILIPLPGEAAEPPQVCGGRNIPLQEDEALVERTLYFHGQAQVGNVDGQLDGAENNATRLTMDPTAPTSDSDKVYATRVTGVIGNPGSARNPHQGYWIRRLDGEEQRIVCAGATVFAATPNGQLPIQLWIDKPRGAGTPDSAKVGTGTAGSVSAYTVNFGALDVTASDNLLVQLDSAPPGTLTHYDSVARPSRFTYVTVEKVEAPT